GFDSELRTRILGMVAHATVSSIDGTLADWPRAVEIASRNPHVRGAAPYVEREAFLRGDAASQGAIIRGVLPDQEPKVSDLDRKMVAGKLSALTPGSWGIVLGKDLALTIGAGVGDKVTVIAALTASPLGALPRFRRFTVVGMFRAYQVARDLADDLGQAYRVQTWMEGHANFFKAVAMEKLVSSSSCR